MIGGRIIIALICLIFINQSFSQIHSGKIVFERRTNLEKELENDRWLDPNKKIKTEEFELIFNDSCAIFKPIYSDENERMSWATNRNTTFQNLNSNQRISLLHYWGQELLIYDTVPTKTWKVTDSKRMISGYECRKAIWEKNDSTRIYAWYSTQILSDAGPEGFHGLPGTILGLATEDGAVIYFAKSVEPNAVKAEDFEIDIKRKKVYTKEEIKSKIISEGSNAKETLKEYDRIFRWY